MTEAQQNPIENNHQTASAEVDVTIADDSWNAVRNAEQIVVRAAQAAAKRVATGDVEISVALSSDAEIQVLNSRYRNQNKPTNVLSFVNGMMLANTGGPVFLGDIIIAYQTVMAEANVEGKSPGDHLAHLTVHGVLHLLGFDHETDDEAERMEALEREILVDIGVADPFHHRFDTAEPEAA